MSENKIAIIAGAGPAGLTAASELLEKTGIKPVVLEVSKSIGGLCRTVNYKGNRMDIGGHRFFSKNDEVMSWWQRKLPMQGAPAMDDLLLGRSDKTYAQGGPDPEKDDEVMLVRERVSRIFFLKKFFDYPISLKFRTLASMGLWRTLKAGSGYLWAGIFKKKEDSLENFYINRFGRPLYRMFFEDYTEKVWGVHPSRIGADWGAQRVKGLSILTILKDMVTRPFRRKDIGQKRVETSLIEQFIYPKYGPGELWEKVAADITSAGGEVRTGCEVTGVVVSEGMVKGVEVRTESGTETLPCDYFFSSMPIKDLVADIKGTEIPADVKKISSELPYRDFITVGLLVRKLEIRNNTDIRTFDGRIPDTWIYIQERGVKVGRLQIFGNWSPYMVKDYKGSMFIGLEYFCNEGDGLWEMSDRDFIEMAKDEMEKIGIVHREDVIDATRIKVRKAYPAYFGSYYRLGTVHEWLDGIGNLFCIGRNGQHRYNNMDHSMLTAVEAVRCIRENLPDKDNVWNVNTGESYHESK